MLLVVKAILVAQKEFEAIDKVTGKGNGTLLLENTVLIIEDMTQEKFYCEKEAGQKMGIQQPDPTKVMSMTLKGSPFKFKVKHVTYTGETFKTSVK